MVCEWPLGPKKKRREKLERGALLTRLSPTDHFLCAGKFAEENKRAPVHNVAEEIHTGARNDPHYQHRETDKVGANPAHTKMH